MQAEVGLARAAAPLRPHTRSSFKLFLELEPQVRDIIFKFYESKYASCLKMLDEMKVRPARGCAEQACPRLVLRGPDCLPGLTPCQAWGWL